MGRGSERSTSRVQAFRRHQAHQEEARAAASSPVYGIPEVPTQSALAQHLAGSCTYFIESALYTEHIDTGATVPWQLNDSQRVVTEEIDRAWAANEMIRLAILKSRRCCISSLCEGIGYWFTSSGPGRRGIVIADKQERTEVIFNTCSTYYAHDQRAVLGLKPGLVNSSKRELKFGNPSKAARLQGNLGLNSQLTVTSAEAKEPGMGGTYLFVHGSEVAYWPEGNPVWKSVGIALSPAPRTIALLESTANGQGGLFHDTYSRAARGPGASDNRNRGQNEWLAIFLPWWMDRRNRVATLTPEDLARFDYFTPQERVYAERWKLTPEQVIWRRRVIAGPQCYKPGVAPEDVFRQEYPAEDDEAFLASGKHFFLLSAVRDLEEDPVKGVREPRARGELANDGQLLEERSPRNRFPVKPTFTADPGGNLRVWEWPKKGTPYLVVCDPAEGLQHGDAAAIGVLDRLRFDWVATWSGRHLSSRGLAHQAALLAWWFYEALLVIEHNNMGAATVQEAQRIVYPRMWYHVDPTKQGAEPGEKAGWLTTPATRQFALMSLEAEVRGKAMGMHDQEFYDQARDFLWPDVQAGSQTPRTPRARAGKFDDKILMGAIGLAVHLTAGVPKHAALDVKAPPVDGPLYPDVKKVKLSEAMDPRRRVKRNRLWG